MGKFSKYGGVAQWDATLKDYVNHTLDIVELTPCRTQYGSAFVAHCDISLDGKTVKKSAKLLTIGQVVFDQLTSYLQEVEKAGENPYPFIVRIAQVERSGAPSYWVLEDPEETD